MIPRSSPRACFSENRITLFRARAEAAFANTDCGDELLDRIYASRTGPQMWPSGSGPYFSRPVGLRHPGVTVAGRRQGPRDRSRLSLRSSRATLVALTDAGQPGDPYGLLHVSCDDRTAPLRVPRSQDAARQGLAFAQRRSAGRHRGGERRGAGRRAICARRSAAGRISQRSRRPVRGRRSHASDRRHHDKAAFAPIAHLTVGGFRDWLLADETTTAVASALAPGVTPEMAAAVSKISRLQDLMVMAAKCTVVTAFRNTVGLPGRLSVRLQPNHPTDDPRGIAASILDGLLLGAGDAVIGINPATDSPASCARAVVDARRDQDQARHPDPKLRARACHHHARSDPQGRAGRSRLPIDRRHGSGQQKLRRRPRVARARRARPRCRFAAARSATT